MTDDGDKKPTAATVISMPDDEVLEAPASYNLILSFAMMFLFAAYLGMQNYLTSVVGQPGYDALAIIFALFGIGNLFASAVIGVLGKRMALIAGAWSHLAIVLAAALAVTDQKLVWLLYPGAAICGSCGTMHATSANIIHVEVI